MHFMVSRSKDAEMFLRAMNLLTVKERELLTSLWSTRDPTGDRGSVPAEERFREGMADSLAALTML